MTEPDRPVAPVVIKKYANRRLYDTESSIYITLDSLADMVRQGREFVVFDAKTGDDITRTVLTQIIVEEETKGRNMLPTAFLRQLITFYGDSLQGIVPDYLEQMMEQFAVQQRAQQAALRATVHKTIQTLLPAGAEANDMALAEPDAAKTAAAEASSGELPTASELELLRAEVVMLRRELAERDASNR